MQVSRRQTVVLGAPGCGKTTSLLHLVDMCFARGILPHEIAFVSFSKRAANEALDRACAKFKYNKIDFPYFRTLHSLAFHQLGLRASEVMKHDDYNRLGEILHAPFTRFSALKTPENVADFGIEKKGDFMLFMESLSRSKMEDYRETYNREHGYKVGWQEFERFAETYAQFKEHNSLLDFTDMLTRFCEVDHPVNVKVAFIDEAQDLSKLQWTVCQSAFRDCDEVVIAGDDDQAIFQWAGADTKSFLDLTGKKVVLQKSHRLPRKIHELACKIVAPIQSRYPKEFSSRDEEGFVKKYRELQHVPTDDEGNWLWLARNTSSLKEIELLLRARHLIYLSKSGCSVSAEHVRGIHLWELFRSGEPLLCADLQLVFSQIKGYRKAKAYIDRQAKSSTVISFSDLPEPVPNVIWHDALTSIPVEQREYYLGILRAGRKLSGIPRHTISTIHGSKGMEADNVVILSDMGKNTHDAYMKNPDSERRVFYVGVTRAKKNLHIVDNEAFRYFKFPHI